MASINAPKQVASSESVENSPEALPPVEFGLAFGGGGARGLAHIPILEACDELGMRPGVIAGTSIGALAGAAYASGLSGRELRDYCASMFASRAQAVKSLMQRWNGSLWDYWNPLTPSLVNSVKLIETVMPKGVAQTFAGLQIPLIVVTTDFYAQKAHIIREGALIPAIAASSALPALFTPVEIDGRFLIDGGFVNPLPCDLLNGRARVIAAVDVTGGPSDMREKTPGTMEAIIGSTQIALHTIIAEKLKAARPDILVSPDVSRFRVLDFLKAEEVWQASAPAKESFKRALAARFDSASV